MQIYGSDTFIEYMRCLCTATRLCSLPTNTSINSAVTLTFRDVTIPARDTPCTKDSLYSENAMAGRHFEDGIVHAKQSISLMLKSCKRPSVKTVINDSLIYQRCGSNDTNSATTHRELRRNGFIKYGQKFLNLSRSFCVFSLDLSEYT
jgi:hypothetical protein